MNSYNQTIHSTTKHTPYEIFYSITLEAYNKSQKNCISFEKYENCLFINNVIKDKNKDQKGYYLLKMNKVKKTQKF